MSRRPKSTVLKDGSQWGIKLAYGEQPRPEGLAQAHIIGADFVGTENSVLILGDNLFLAMVCRSNILPSASTATSASAHTWRAWKPKGSGRTDRVVGVRLCRRHNR
jgi:glucose-1-phosphate thymidylyltransferase